MKRFKSSIEQEKSKKEVKNLRIMIVKCEQSLLFCNGKKTSSVNIQKFTAQKEETNYGKMSYSKWQSQ